LRHTALAGTAALALWAAPAAAQVATISQADGVHAGELTVPVSKSQVLRTDRPFARALIGDPAIADVLPLTDRSLYVLGKKAGTTSLTLYDRNNSLIAVMDVAVGPDVISLRRQLSEMVPGSDIGARISNDAVVLEGVVPSGPAADRALRLAETFAPGKVVNLLSVGASQQVMLEVRFSEVKRSALKEIGVGLFTGSDDGRTRGVSGGGAALNPDSGDVDGDGNRGEALLTLGAITDSFGILSRTFRAFGTNFEATLNALERKGAITTLAEPTLIALSGETASFLAGGEFPIPTAQSGGLGAGAGGQAITVEFKPFGVGLAFTPTVLADGIINLVVAPEVSSIDPSASVVINGLRVPGLQTRRAKTVVELRDGESFAMAGLLRRDFSDTIRQVPVLGNLPIIGALFRSTGFNREETELVIIVTPRLVAPVRAGQLKVPTDRVKPPEEADLFFLGRTDTGVGPVPELGIQKDHNPRQAPKPAKPQGSGASNSQTPAPGPLAREYGHVL
jgi:pilus assembly protein CpaC